MLTANRFDKIKAQIHDWETKYEMDGDLAHTMLLALKDLAAEVDRSRNVPQISGSKSHVKPMILGADGKPVLPPPLVQQFAAERREQYAKDRHVALTLCTPEDWRVFALRWGLAPPPGGWEEHEQIINMMHRVRLDVVTISHLERQISAVHCKARGIALPQGCTLENGVYTDARTITQDPA